jgi:hypothetical protein
MHKYINVNQTYRIPMWNIAQLKFLETVGLERVNFSSMSETRHRKGAFRNLVRISDTYREFRDKCIRLQLFNILCILHSVKLMTKLVEILWRCSIIRENRTSCSHVSARLERTNLQEYSYRRRFQKVLRNSKLGRYWTEYTKINLRTELLIVVESLGNILYHENSVKGRHYYIYMAILNNSWLLTATLGQRNSKAMNFCVSMTTLGRKPRQVIMLHIYYLSFSALYCLFSRIPK